MSGDSSQPPELDFITVRGFKSIRQLDKFQISPINVLIGANGSGKSNFINIFSFMHEVREGRLQEYVRRSGGAEQVLFFGSKATPNMEFSVSFKNGVNSYYLKLSSTANDSLVPIEERAGFWDKARYSGPFETYLVPVGTGLEAGISDPVAKRIADWVKHRLGRWRVYHLHDTSSSSPMRKTSQIADNHFLRNDASNLASFLFLLKQKHLSSYQEIVGVIKRVAPYFGDFNLQPDSLNQDTIRLSWKHTSTDRYFGPASLSDGTIRFMALATLFLQPTEFRPQIIIVDEPELGLHPSAISMLASLVKQASTSTQIILSTQSPLLLDHFEPQDVIVAERVDDSTTLRRIDSVHLSEWLEEYSLGQLWEKNELGGRPS